MTHRRMPLSASRNLVNSSAVGAAIEYGAPPATRPPTLGPLVLGAHVVWPPVVLAPMAGITNVAFRRLCREQGGGVHVCEMITTRALVERIPKTLKMIAFAPYEGFRSLQLYGVDPDVIAAAVRMVAEDNLADHIDLNFGCPKLIDCQRRCQATMLHVRGGMRPVGDRRPGQRPRGVRRRCDSGPGTHRGARATGPRTEPAGALRHGGGSLVVAR
jgi:hypothetical protein